MKWGLQAQWGLQATWGALSDADAADEVCDFAVDRLLVHMREGPNLRKLLCALFKSHGNFKSVAADILAAFDIDTARGDQLDKLGALVGQARLGFDDADLRRLIEIQGRRVLGSSGTGETILGIVRHYLGEAAPPISYREYYPAAFQIEIGGMSSDDRKIMLDKVRKAKPGGVDLAFVSTSASSLRSDLIGGGITSPKAVDLAPGTGTIEDAGTVVLIQT